MTELEKNELRNECYRFFMCKTLNDSLELIDIHTEFLYQVIMKHHKEPVECYADTDAKMVVQMMLTKTLHLKNIVNGITYNSIDGTSLNRIIDPTIVASMIRNIYETIGMFNLIFRNANNGDEKTILYNLWVYSGLKYRQRFEQFATTEESTEKIENEKQQLEKLITAIKETDLYQNLDDKNQKIIKKKIKAKNYLLKFDGTMVVPLHWQALTETIGIETDLFDNIYTYFSLYSHPSNVAVFQFKDMFNREDEVFKVLTNTNLRYYFALTSIFIADLINLFPSVQETFDNLNLRDQIVINFHNTLHRGYGYSINESWKILE